MKKKIIFPFLILLLMYIPLLGTVHRGSHSANSSVRVRIILPHREIDEDTVFEPINNTGTEAIMKTAEKKHTLTLQNIEVEKKENNFVVKLKIKGGKNEEIPLFSYMEVKDINNCTITQYPIVCKASPNSHARFVIPSANISQKASRIFISLSSIDKTDNISILTNI